MTGKKPRAVFFACKPVKFALSALVFAAALSGGGPAAAAAFQVSAEADRNSVPLNGSFSLTIAVQSGGEEADSLIFPDGSHFPDFQILSQSKNSSVSIRLINGKLQNRRVIRQVFRLKPKAEGEFLLKSLFAQINGKTHAIKPLAISVTEPEPGAAAQPAPFLPFIQGLPFFQNPPAPGGAPPDPFGSWPFSRPKPSKNPLPARIRARLSKASSAYKGERIEAEWILLSSSESVQPRPEKRPALKGFWKEEAKKSFQGSFLGTEVVEGALYRKTLLDAMVLFPLETGELEIDSYAAKISAFSGFRFYEQTAAAPPLKIHVKPLPPGGRGLFSGAVGKFQVEASLREKEARVNKPLTYRLRFEGTGHPRFIKLPPLPLPDSARRYPAAEKSEFSSDGLSWKAYEILIAPEKPGVLKIPGFEITSFDPDKGEYTAHSIPSFSVPVYGAAAQEDEGERFFEGPAADSPAKKAQEDLMAALTEFNWPWIFDSRRLWRFWLAFYSLLAAAILALSLGPGLFKKRLSLKESLRERWLQIDRLIEKKDWQRAALRLISLACFVLREGKIGEGAANWRDLIESLPPSRRQRCGRRLRHLMEELESLSFAPRSLSEREALTKVKALAREGKKILSQLI